MKEYNEFYPKFKSTVKQIPVYDVKNKIDFYDFVHKETPFIIYHNLSSHLKSVLIDIELIEKETKIMTYDGIPYNEIREGRFFDYLDYFN